VLPPDKSCMFVLLYSCIELTPSFTRTLVYMLIYYKKIVNIFM